MITIEPSELTEFTIFNDLPPELRAKVWRFSLPPARKINVDIKISRSKKPRSGGHYIKSSDKNPATLYINQESRYETLRIYKPLFSLTGGCLPHEAPIFYNPVIDTIQLLSLSGKSPGVLDYIEQRGGKEDLNRIQLLELHRRKWNKICYSRPRNVFFGGPGRTCLKFGGLKCVFMRDLIGGGSVNFYVCRTLEETEEVLDKITLERQKLRPQVKRPPSLSKDTKLPIFLALWWID